MKKAKRLTALIGVIFLVALYLITLISAIFTTPATASLFKVCIFSTMVVPIILYLATLVFHVFERKEDYNNDEAE